ncbi:MAG TPA: alanine racemase [Oligoflexia bacterium]|nr:alanine racemase [Oligoflexia bacterium]HMP48632.1 alanine racemase [Oligoflexia bacterium]
MRPSHLQINLSSIAHNLGLIKKFVKPAKVMAIVKANAYGHGLIPVAKVLEEYGADYLGVAFVEEGVTLRKSGIKLPILTLGGISGRQIGLFLDHDLDITASSVSKLEAIDQAARNSNKIARVHLKIDTGMERIGVHYYSTEIENLISKSLSSKNIELISILSHLADSESVDTSFMKEQLNRFTKCLEPFKSILPKNTILHIANSGGILSSKDCHLQMVRPGRILYGVSPAPHLNHVLPLIPSLALTSEVVYFKVVKKGATVSYGRTWEALEDTRVVTIPLGYGDGLPRRYGNVGSVLIRGKKYPITGTICMDQLMVNIGPKGEAYNGDQVTIIGSDGDESISVTDLANIINAEPLEILTSLNTRLPRQYIL